MTIFLAHPWPPNCHMVQKQKKVFVYLFIIFVLFSLVEAPHFYQPMAGIIALGLLFTRSARASTRGVPVPDSVLSAMRDTPPLASKGNQ